MSGGRKPNLLFIMSDQHRADCLGRQGRYPVIAPNLDRLAEEGVRFTHAYTPIPLCCPARQAFLNGRRPETFGALWNYDNSLPIQSLSPDEYAWPRELQQAGYRSAYLGKWHVHPDHDPTRYGYDLYINEGQFGAARREKHPGIKFQNGFFGDTDRVPELAYTKTHWFAGRTSELIREYAAGDQPWHIRLDFSDPHLPCHPHASFEELYADRDIPAWGSFGDQFHHKPYIQRQQLLSWKVDKMEWEDWRPIVARYYALITQVDDAVGQVLQTLEETGQAGNTIVVYTSDHGDMCGGHRMMDKHYVMYDDVVRVPLIVRYPGVAKSGSVREEFVYNLLDLPPTLLEWLDMPVPEHLQGCSLRGLLEGTVEAGWRTEVVSTYNGQQFGLYNQRMIRNNEWKYIWNPTDVDELYDMQRDPDELVNRIADPSLGDVLKSLRARLLDVLQQDGDRLVKSPWMREQLLSEDGKLCE